MKAFRIPCHVTSTNLPIGGQSPLKSAFRPSQKMHLWQQPSRDIGNLSQQEWVSGGAAPLRRLFSATQHRRGRPAHAMRANSAASLRHKTTIVSAVLPGSISHRKLSPPSPKSAAPSNQPQIEWLCATTSKPTQG